MYRVAGRSYIDIKSNVSGGWLFFDGVNEVTSEKANVHEMYEEAIDQVREIFKYHFGRYFLTIQVGKVTKSTEWNQVHHPHNGYD